MSNENNSGDIETPGQMIHTSGAPGQPERIQDGSYKIYTALSETKLVDMALAESNNGSRNVKLYADSNALESTWSFYYNTNKAAYVIRNRKITNLELGRPTSDFDNVAAIAPPASDPVHYWFLKSADQRHYYLEHIRDGRLMEVKDSGTANNTNIILRPYSGATNQKFRLELIRPISN